MLYDLLYGQLFINVKCKLKNNVYSADIGNRILYIFLSLIYVLFKCPNYF